uniref:golgin subfamily A member 6-like protein 1 n=1 Tax=Scatophagus argus TaxID=75038 RepID=UPI001ED7E5C8|nr:golgin subfamily A member 6-like protein 1 [Scatophagus argus]
MERRDSQPSWADIMEMEDISFDEENKKLKAELQEAKDEIRRKENKISSLQRNLSALEENYYTAIKKEREKAEHELKKKEEEIFYVRKRLHAQSKETERVRASLDEWKKSTKLNSVEEKWQRKVSQLEELLLQKDKLVRQADNKRRARAKAHIDTLAQLGVTESALKQSRQTCEALEQKIQSQLAERNVSHQKKLLEQEKGFKKELEEKPGRKVAEESQPA